MDKSKIILLGSELEAADQHIEKHVLPPMIKNRDWLISNAATQTGEQKAKTLKRAEAINFRIDSIGSYIDTMHELFETLVDMAKIAYSRGYTNGSKDATQKYGLPKPSLSNEAKRAQRLAQVQNTWPHLY